VFRGSNTGLTEWIICLGTTYLFICITTLKVVVDGNEGPSFEALDCRPRGSF